MQKFISQDLNLTPATHVALSNCKGDGLCEGHMNVQNEIILVKTAACLLSPCKLDVGLTEIKTVILAYLDIVETPLALNEQGEEFGRLDCSLQALLSLSPEQPSIQPQDQEAFCLLTADSEATEIKECLEKQAPQNHWLKEVFDTKRLTYNQPSVE